ncbi:MAG TPA: hypothetical protein VMH86_10065 [Rhizomicrobium sp.]|nr:hypothetical protein [Rhizomicrobium sp.]
MQQIPPGGQSRDHCHRIAVIAGDAAVRDSLCRLLESFDIAADGFATAAAYLGHAPSHCLAIADEDLGAMSGFDLVEVMRLGGVAIPAIVLSDGWSQHPRGPAGGCVTVAKPVQADALIAEIRNATAACAGQDDAYVIAPTRSRGYSPPPG